MRKNHHGKKDRLVKRVFALCLALAVICTCLVPVFATEGLIDPQVHQEASRPVDDGVASYPDDEAAGFGGDEVATRPVEGGEEEATRPAEGEGGEDNLDGGPNVKETEWGTVIEYDTSTSTSTDPSSSTETQWSGEDDVVEKPDDKVVVSGDEIKKLQDMVVYRFWLKELNTLDLQDIATQAQINNMTESEYLARNGEVLWNLYFIQAVPRAETIADYSSYIENPSSNRDPKGELRQFDYWYTLDEFGNRVRLNLTDPTSNILDDKTTTVNVYAAWKDGTVGSDEEEDVDHEDLVDKNPVPVDLAAKASASYEDEEGNPKTTTLPVEVKNLPAAADHLSVIHMGYDDVGDFYQKYSNDFGDMAPLLGLEISPKNTKGEKVQLAEGEKATVTVSDLDKLPEIAAMEEAGALTADALKVLHQKDDGTVEKLDVVSYENGTLTFETSSFSPFVIALTGGYDTELLDERAAEEEAGLYILCNLDKSANSNNPDVWTGIVKVGDSNAKLGDLTGASWTDGDHNDSENILFSDIGGAGSTTAQQYIYCWPDGVTYTGPRTLIPGVVLDKNFRKTLVKYNGESSPLEKVIFDVYKGTLVELYTDKGFDPQKVEGLVEGLGPEKITFTITPHKISRKNNEGSSGNPDKHIDCTITVACDLTFTAVFNVMYPGKDGYRDVDRKVYLWDAEDTTKNTVTKNVDNKTVPKEYTDGDGVKWEFDGWYPEKEDGTGPNLDADPISTWPYTVQEYQLTNNKGDRVVNFYAHYTKKTSNVTITKEVTGLLGDTNKDFAFSVSIKQGDKDCTGVKAMQNNVEVPLTNITLKHRDSVTLENVPIGATITVTEVNPGDHYTVSANGKAGVEDASGNVTFTYVAVANTPTTTANDTGEAELMLLSMDEDTAVDADGDAVAYDSGIEVDNNQIIVTNHATLEPDTGVLLDTLPYIVILVVVAGGVALLMLRKRRKEDD